MKKIKVLGLAIVASIVAAPAFAGETYVRNESIKSWGHTETDLHMDSVTKSNRHEAYGSFADKVYYDGDVDLTKKLGRGGLEVEVDYDDYTKHTAGSLLLGKFNESNKTTVDGTIYSFSEFKSNSHETSAGVR